MAASAIYSRKVLRGRRHSFIHLQIRDRITYGDQEQKGFCQRPDGSFGASKQWWSRFQLVIVFNLQACFVQWILHGALFCSIARQNCETKSTICKATLKVHSCLHWSYVNIQWLVKIVESYQKEMNLLAGILWNWRVPILAVNAPHSLSCIH